MYNNIIVYLLATFMLFILATVFEFKLLFSIAL